MYLFTVGTKMTWKTAPKMMVRGFGIMTAKVGVATGLALLVSKVFGGELFGLSTLAVMVAMSDTNGGMFMALTSVMGSREDSATYVPQSIETGPFLTMLIFVGIGLAVIPWLTMVSVVAPIVVGALSAISTKTSASSSARVNHHRAVHGVLTLGQTIDLKSVVTAARRACCVGIMVLASSRHRLHPHRSPARRLRYRRVRPHRARLAIRRGSTRPPPCRSGIRPIAAAATVQVTVSVIVTAILTPPTTSLRISAHSDTRQTLIRQRRGLTRVSGNERQEDPGGLRPRRGRLVLTRERSGMLSR